MATCKRGKRATRRAAGPRFKTGSRGGNHPSTLRRNPILHAVDTNV
eukprot:COSAG03_NODE_14129_length_475_cov_2.630319_1_plen_45_part_01